MVFIVNILVNNIKFQPQIFNESIVFCLVDNTASYQTDWIRELIKNQTDYIISDIYGRRYVVLQGLDEDDLLRSALRQGFKHAVVFSTGTEFINGPAFFEEIENIVNTKYSIAGHILDRGDAYYELHHQCYLINLTDYNELGCPAIGKQELGSKHTQIVPIRSTDNIHDDYTPTWVNAGLISKEYYHKCHGWNILSKLFENNLTVRVFDKSIRNNKKHYYPENITDFQKHSDWIYYRQQYCLQEFVHTASTEGPHADPGVKIRQVVTPASGTWYENYIDTENPVTVVFYDYNLQSIEYWKKHAPARANVTYKFVHCDLLSSNVEFDLDPTLDTLVNLSNIFCYEGTTFFAGLRHRANKENQLLIHLKETVPNAYVYFSTRAASGYKPKDVLFSKAKDIDLTDITTLIKPTWHINQDWC